MRLAEGEIELDLFVERQRIDAFRKGLHRRQRIVPPGPFCKCELEIEARARPKANSGLDRRDAFIDAAGVNEDPPFRAVRLHVVRVQR